MEPTKSPGEVRLEIDRGIAAITFSTPIHNAMPGVILASLAAAIDDAGAHPDVRVVILRSGGSRTFCAGASFDELAAIRDETAGRAFFMGFARVIDACRRCPRLIIGRIQGKAIGGGVGLAAAVDYALASEHASIRLSELSIGIGPFVVGPAIQRKIGAAAFGHLAIDASNFKSASWAQEKGLFADVFSTEEGLEETVVSMAERIAAMNPDATAAFKRLLWEGTDHWETLLPERAALSGRLILSPEAQAALQKYR
ncbi:MAG: enoyl-CoA hydratase/isomerase family protein [Rhodothermales bacterium]